MVLEVCYEQFWTLGATSIVPGKSRFQNVPFQAGKAKWALDEVRVYLRELVLLEGFPGLWRSAAGMFSACFSVWGLCCGSLWLWGTRYQVFFFGYGEYMGRVKGIKGKRVERGEITKFVLQCQRWHWALKWFCLELNQDKFRTVGFSYAQRVLLQLFFPWL